jgi:signal transduction histidine kinase
MTQAQLIPPPAAVPGRIRLALARELPAAGFVAAVVLLGALFRRLVIVVVQPDEHAPAFAIGLWLDFRSHLVVGLVMLAVVQTVRRRGPQGGARRIAALGIAVVVAAALAAIVSSLGLNWSENPEEGWSALLPILIRFSILGALLLTVAEFYRAEVRSLDAMRDADAARATLEQQTLQARLRTLEAQVEPHFLFNTLATVRRLYETDREAGEAMIEGLMRYLEVALPSMRGERSTLDREARLIEAYLELQRVRMGRRLTYRVDIAIGMRALEVPPMMLLTLVENAIKHGLAPRREGGRVEVGARLEGDRVCLEVSDTGRGFGGDTAGGGTGLANIRARLAATFGSAAQFTLATRSPHGVHATICMPAIRPERAA